MKSTNLTFTLCAILLSIGLLHAQKAKPAKDFTENLANNMIKSISRDIILADSQKVALQTCAKEYEVKMKELKGQANANHKKEKNKEAVEGYRAKLNQILTKEQLDTIQTKRIQRAIDNATKNNQK